MARQLFVTMVLLLAPVTLWAQSSRDFSIQVSAAVSAAPARITLSWPARTDLNADYVVYRKSRDAAAWGTPLATVPRSGNGYVDTAVSPGVLYEYRVNSNLALPNIIPIDGYVLSGIDIPLVESRGRVVLVVDNTFATDLAAELTTFEQDLRGDGWTPVRVGVNRNDSVVTVKNAIRTQYNSDPANTKAVLLFGRVPVPYSGLLSRWPDGHLDHAGAWATDLFYGDLDGNWTDVGERINDLNGAPLPPRGQNRPGDGKYDNYRIPTPVELMVGRVDLANMSEFPTSEKELLRQYLVKDHRFRHKQTIASEQALIDENVFFGTPPQSASGLRSFVPMFGSNNVRHDADFYAHTTFAGTDSFMWAYGSGGGSYTTCAGVIVSANFAQSSTRVVFTMLFGSYFGDFDTDSNLLRAPLGTAGYTLTCAWAGSPSWYFHHMAMGEPIGFSARTSQNNSVTYDSNGLNGASPGMVCMNLMGDPTLRMHIVAPPRDFTGTSSGVLSWNAPQNETVLGYNVYRATSAAGPFTKLNSSLITGTTYTDGTLSTGATYTYMLRAVKLQTGSGTYFNASQGIFTTVTAGGSNLNLNTPVANPAQVLAGATVNFSCTANGGGTLAWSWEFGDGETSSAGSNVSHSFERPGIYTVRATARDNATGQSASATCTVEVRFGITSNIEATPNAAGCGESIKFDCTATNEKGVTWSWDFGDGTTAQTSSGSISHVYTIPGSYQIEVTATYSDTGETASSNTKVDVDLSLVSAPQATPNPATIGQPVNFSCAANATTGVKWTWNFGDGTTAQGANPTHVYTTAGNYLVTVTAGHKQSGQQVSATLLAVVTAAAIKPPGDSPTKPIMPDDQGIGNENDDGNGGGDVADQPQGPEIITRPVRRIDVSALGLSCKFGLTGKDSCTMSAILPELPQSFAPDGQVLVIDVAGAIHTFALNAQGKGSSATGTVSLKRSKRGGGTVLKLNGRRGAWASDWMDDGILPGKTTNGEQLSLDVSVQWGGEAYTARVTGTYTGKAGKGGKFKK